MAIELIDKIKPKNGGSFPMVDAADVQMGDGTRLSDFLDTTLAESGKAAESAAVGQYFTQAMMTFGSELANKQPKGNYVKSVNGQIPNENGNVTVEAGGVTEEYVQEFVANFTSGMLDTTLTKSGMAADAAAAGQRITQSAAAFERKLAEKQPKGNYVQTVNGQTPDADGNVVVEGGGGGVISWNDLTDKPFYEEVSLETIVPEETYSGFVFLSGLNLYGKAGMNWFSLQEGEKYIVRWHGEEWPVTAFKMAQQGMEAIVLGNEKLLSGESATPVEPFVVYQITANNYCAVCAFDQEASHTFGIFKDGTVIHPLDAKFLPMEAIDARIEQYIEEALGGDY